MNFNTYCVLLRPQQALQLSKALNQAIERLLENRKSPGRKVNQLDNRASNFYIALYWAEFMALQDPENFQVQTTLSRLNI